MQKLKLEKVTHYDKDQEGKALIGKNSGKPYTRCIIVADNKRYSGFGSQVTRNWKEGDTVEVEVIQNGQWLNFKLPNPNVTRVEFQEVVKRIVKLEQFVINGGKQQEFPLPEPPIEEQIDDLFTEGENVA